LENVVQAIREDLRGNALSFLRALQALVMYGHVGAQVLERAKGSMEETLKSLGIEVVLEGPEGKWIGHTLSYAGLGPREAAILDLATFGENRTIDEVQEHVFKMGFMKERKGQIRSAINAKANRGTYFKVTGNDAVSLTAEGREQGKVLKKRMGVG
jgi:hypothetical protein